MTTISKGGELQNLTERSKTSLWSSHGGSWKRNMGLNRSASYHSPACTCKKWDVGLTIQYCTNCNASMDVGGSFCVRCGASVKAGEGNSIRLKPVRSATRTVLLGLLVSILLAVAAFAISIVIAIFIGRFFGAGFGYLTFFLLFVALTSYWASKAKIRSCNNWRPSPHIGIPWDGAGNPLVTVVDFRSEI